MMPPDSACDCTRSGLNCQSENCHITEVTWKSFTIIIRSCGFQSASPWQPTYIFFDAKGNEVWRTIGEIDPQKVRDSVKKFSMGFIRWLSFNFWYFQNPPWDSGISPPELLDFIANQPAGRAIDIGCGTGTNVITLAQNGWRVTGIDFVPRAIQIAKRKFKNISVELQVNDATKLKGINGPFDLALDMGCFHGIDKKADYLSQLSRVLAPGGHWLMYGFFKSDSQQSGSGLAAPDLDLISSFGFRLVSRKDGVDKRERPSAWFLYRKGLDTAVVE